VGFEPTIPATAWPQTYVIDGAATGIGPCSIHCAYTCITFTWLFIMYRTHTHRHTHTRTHTHTHTHTHTQTHTHTHTDAEIAVLDANILVVLRCRAESHCDGGGIQNEANKEEL
jgi:hypothetical protein